MSLAPSWLRRLAALGVDLGLFALTALNPPPAPRLSPDTEAEIKRAIGVTLQRSGKDLEWLKKHIYSHGASAYFAVPNYYSALNKDTIEKADDHELARWAGIRDDKTGYFKEALSDAERGEAKTKLLAEIGDRNELQDAQALNLLAGVLVDLDLMRLMTRGQLKRARRDEERESLSVMPRYNKDGRPEYEKIRNHGVLSKARHALRDAGWSTSARRDAEVYIMIDTEGLSPFLKAFNQAGAESGAGGDAGKSGGPAGAS